MSLVPVYAAHINHVHYGPIIGWNTPITYNRPSYTVGALAGHKGDPYSATENMRPFMSPSPFPDSAISFYPNNGAVDGGAYDHKLISGDPADFGLTGLWNLSLLAQVQMVEWSKHLLYHEAFIEALTSRTIEDAWLTTKTHFSLAKYEEDLALASFATDDTKSGPLTIINSLATTASGKPVPSIDATPCVINFKWMGYRGSYYVLETIENLVAFYDDPPELLWAPHELIEGHILTYGHGESLASLGIAGRTLNGVLIREIQPEFYEPARAVEYERAVAAVPGAPNVTWKTVMPYNEVADVYRQALAYFAGTSADVFRIIKHNSGGGSPTTLYQEGSVIYNEFASSVLDFLIPNGVPFTSYNTEWGLAGYPWISVTADAGGTPPSAVDPWNNLTIIATHYYDAEGYSQRSVYSTASTGTLNPARPVKWDHTNPIFDGYVPYHTLLHSSDGMFDYLREYIKNPDDRFDGLYFAFMVKASTVTRNWHAYVRNVLAGTDPDPIALKSGKLEAYAWRDTRTNEIINEIPNCSLMTPVSIGFSSDLVTNPTYPGFSWDNYEWPDPVISIPPGTFLFEDGNAAPIYPDFKGAYVYDMHLKKWGKFDGDYKRLLDYSAINTYMPNQQSFTRFGIFGGVLTADGKIRLFDDAPAVASITYGKIGYYRQGMTSLEEIRIHHRDFKTGAVRINSSIEGKLIEPSFTTTTNFIASSMWQVNGGYAAKWHTITVLGSFDLSYMEFRGIPAGRR